ncbi:MAG: PHP domain-containing protein [Oscillospiraceae bacterium]
MLYDLHLHTCLSPCANEDMTPSTVAGMAKLAGADLIAVTDHNSALNLPAAQKACDAYGLRLLPGIEVNTAEEIHLLCYFPSVAAALSMSDIIYNSLPDFEYDYNIWGKQQVMDENDQVKAVINRLLTNASGLDIYKAKSECERLGGIAVPAHADKDSYSLLAVLGFCPEDLDFAAIELHSPNSYDNLSQKGLLPQNKEILTSSDAHCIENIASCLKPLAENSVLRKLLY